METDSKKKKRGRPSVFLRTLGDESLAEVIRQSYDLESERSITNELYYQEGMSIARKLCDTRKIFFTPKGKSRRNCILEQIGRLLPFGVKNISLVSQTFWAMLMPS